MDDSAQKRAIETYRSKLAARGMARFEIQACETDRDLIRALARKMADGSPEASKLRTTVQQAMNGAPPQMGGIFAALRRSPLVGADLEFSRPREDGRKIDL